MADTRHLTLAQIADVAGTRRDPYSGEDIGPLVVDEHRCLACGAPFGGRKTKQGLLVVYCGDRCRKAGQKVWRQRTEDEAALHLKAYVW